MCCLWAQNDKYGTFCYLHQGSQIFHFKSHFRHMFLMEIWLKLVIYDLLLLIDSAKMANLGLFDFPEPLLNSPMVPFDWESNCLGV